MNFDSSAFVADQELVRALRERAKVVDCKQDRILFRQGDHPTGLYIVCGGEVLMTMQSSAGDEVVSFASEPGSLLGLPGVVGNSPYSLSAYAKAGADVYFVNREEFSSLMISDPSLAVLILKVLANEVRSARRAITGK